MKLNQLNQSYFKLGKWKTINKEKRMRKIAELGDITLNELLYGFQSHMKKLKIILTLEMKQILKQLYDFYR